MTNRVAIARASIWRVLQERGIVHGDAQTTVRIARDAIPDMFIYKGIPLTWPFGREKDILKGVRLDRLNQALVLNRNKPIPERLATMKTCRLAYTALWQMTKRPEYDPSPDVKPTIEHVTPKHRVPRKAIERLEQALKDLGGN